MYELRGDESYHYQGIKNARRPLTLMMAIEAMERQQRGSNIRQRNQNDFESIYSKREK